MPVAIGGLIYGSNYNSVQTTISTVLGTYYGQTVSSSQISNPNTTKITVAQWQALYTDILTCYNHQNGSNGSLTYPTTSKTILASDFNAYESMANNTLTNYTNFYSGYSASQSFSTLSIPGGWGNSSTNTAIHTLTVSFTNTTYASYYFNAGGQIRFTAGLTSNGSAKDNSWSSMLSHMGTIAFGVNTTTTLPGAVTPGTPSSIGYNQLTGSYQLIYSKGTENSTYTPNTYNIYATISGATITFKIEFEDLSGPAYQGQYNIDEAVGGAATSATSLYYASGAGQVTVTSYLPTLGTNSYIFSTPNP
jgi:hypothetical protein